MLELIHARTTDANHPWNEAVRCSNPEDELLGVRLLLIIADLLLVELNEVLQCLHNKRDMLLEAGEDCRSRISSLLKLQDELHRRPLLRRDLRGLLQSGLLELQDNLLEVGALLADEESKVPRLNIQSQGLGNSSRGRHLLLTDCCKSLLVKYEL